MARSITATRIHKGWCNPHEIPDIKRVILQGRTEQKLDWHLSVEYNYFDPIPEMDKVLEFVSPSHSGLEWLDRPQEYEVSISMNA